MPKKKTPVTPTEAPTGKPTRKSTRASTARSTTPLTVTPIRRTTRTPTPRPTATSTSAPTDALGNIVYHVHELIDFERHRKCHPNYYGEYLGEFLTPAYAKRWLRDHERYGAFAIVEMINGRIGQAWPHEIDPPDLGAGDNDLSLLDPDDIDLDDADLLNPAIFRTKIENAKLRAQLDASRNGNGHSPMMERLFEKLLTEKFERPDPLDELIAKEEKSERLRAIYAPPRRESNPAPQPQRSEEEIIASAVFKHPEVIETVIDSALKRFGSKEGGDAEPWYAEPIKDAVKTGQAAAIVREFFSGAQGVAQGLAGNIFSMFAPKPAQMPAQEAQHQTQQPTPTAPVQPQQVAPADTPVLMESNQQSQPTPEAAHPQTDQGPMQMAPVDALVYHLIQLCEKQAPVSEAVTLVNISVVRNPDLGDSVDQLLDLPTDQTLAMLAAYHPPVAQMTHAREWLTSLINALTAEGGNGDFDEVTEIGEGSVKL